MSSIISGAAEATQFVYEDILAKGVGLWGKMAGQRNSSTRMEIAGFLIALMRNVPVLVGTDSQSLIDKANSIIRAIRQQLANPLWWITPNSSVLGKPWGLQPDGDLWQLVHEAIITRGVDTVALVKCKGHATTLMVEQGKVDADDKEGNDWSDIFATKGTNQHGSQAIELANWFKVRQGQYANMIKDVQRLIIEVLKAEKIERMARRAQAVIIQGFDISIYAMVTCSLPRDTGDGPDLIFEEGPATHTPSVLGEGATPSHTPSMLGEGASSSHTPRSVLGEGAGNGAITLLLSEPSGGIHKFSGQQLLYQCVHNFSVHPPGRLWPVVPTQEA
jgi:hypothetical protein